MNSTPEAEWDPIQYERPFWEPLGRMVINFGHLEKTVDWAIGAFLRVHERQGEAVTSQILNLASRIKLITKLCNLLTSDAEERRAIKAMEIRISALNTFRNQVVHGQWGAYHVNEKAYTKVSVNPRNFEYKSVSITVPEIEATAGECFTLSVDLTNLTQKIIREYERQKSVPPR